MTSKIWFERDEIVSLAERATKALDSSNEEDCILVLAYLGGYLSGAASNPIREQNNGEK